MALEFDKSTSIQQNNLIAQKIETYIIQQPEVATVFSNIGGPSTGIGSLGVGSENKTEFTIQLKSKKELRNLPTETFMKNLREELKSKDVYKRQMKGKAHDELHKWLLPYIDLVKELSEAKDETEASKHFENIQISFTTFNQYFQ